MSIKFQLLRITKVVDETPEAYSLYFDRPDTELFSYQPGQYLTLKVTVAGEELRRSYSLSSSPHTDEYLSVAIKRVPDGRVSHYLRDSLGEGDEIEVLPPMGSFVADIDPAHTRNYILICGGSGITPLLSITKSVLQEEPDSVVTLWYGNRKESSIIFLNELTGLQKAYPGRLTILHFLTQPSQDWRGRKGRLTKEVIYDLISDLFMVDEHRKKYYLCGPAGLIESAEAALEKHAVNMADVHREYYSAPPPSEEEVARAYAVEEAPEKPSYEPQQVTLILDGDEHDITVNPDQDVLAAAMEVGLDPPYSCLDGICSSCRALLKSGKVEMEQSLGLSEEEKEEGFVLTCQAHPLTDDVILEYM